MGDVVTDEASEGGEEVAETAAANEVTGSPRGVSLPWTRPRPKKGGEQDLPPWTAGTALGESLRRAGAVN